MPSTTEQPNWPSFKEDGAIPSLKEVLTISCIQYFTTCLITQSCLKEQGLSPQVAEFKLWRILPTSSASTVSEKIPDYNIRHQLIFTSRFIQLAASHERVQANLSARKTENRSSVSAFCPIHLLLTWSR